MDTGERQMLRGMTTVSYSVQDRGEGFITATVIDPFGNVLGLMYNPHYLAVLNSHSQA